MKIVWKGFLNEHNLFIYSGLPANAKKLISDKRAWITYLLIIPVLILAYTGIRLT